MSIGCTEQTEVGGGNYFSIETTDMYGIGGRKET
jgi:hypothetical protein